jgi:hypothetical protein
MEQDNVIAMPPQSNDWSKLIRKLRWIGMKRKRFVFSAQCSVCLLKKEARYRPGRSAATR